MIEMLFGFTSLPLPITFVKIYFQWTTTSATFSSKSLTDSSGNQFIYDPWFAFYFQYIYETDLRTQLRTNPLQTSHSNDVCNQRVYQKLNELYEADISILKEQ